MNPIRIIVAIFFFILFGGILTYVVMDYESNKNKKFIKAGTTITKIEIESKEDVQENIPLDKVPETEDDIAIEHITNSIPEPQKELDREEKSKKLTPEIN